MSLPLFHWYPGSGVVLIVSNPDLCHLTYFTWELFCGNACWANVLVVLFFIQKVNFGPSFPGFFGELSSVWFTKSGSLLPLANKR